MQGSNQGPQDPQTLDALSQLIMRLPRASSPVDGAAFQPAAQPPAQPPIQSPPSGTADLEARAAQPRTAPVPTAQPPSDDPAITQAQAGLSAANTNMQSHMQSYEDTQKKIQAVPQVNPQDYKPKWYDRLLGAGVGFAVGAGGNPVAGAQMGTNASFRRLNTAESQRQRTVAPLLQQLQSEREELPMLTAAQTSAKEQYQGARDTSKLGIQSQAALDKAEVQNQLADTKQRLADITLKLGTDKNANYQGRTDEQLKAAQLRADSVRDRTDKMADRKKDHTAQSLLAEHEKTVSLTQAHDAYNKATANLPKGPLKDEKGNPQAWSDEDLTTLKQAQDDLKQAQDLAQDEYQRKSIILGAQSDDEPSKPAAKASPAAGKPSTTSGGTQKAPKPGTQLTDKSIAQGYLKAAGGDKNKARELAKGDGWKL